MPLLTCSNSDGADEFVSLRENQAKLAKKYSLDLDTLDYAYPGGGVKQVAFSPRTNEWYGWSHRAIAGFKVGSVVKKGDVIAQGVAANLRQTSAFPVGFKAKTLDDAKRMAQTFANEVS